MADESPSVGRRRLIPAAAALMGSTALQAVTAFAANLVLVRFIAPAEFGRYALAMASIALFFAVCSLRINTLVIRSEDERLDRDTRVIYFSAIVQETLLVGLLSAGLLAATGRMTGLTTLLLIGLLLRHFGGNSRSFYERRMRYLGLAGVEGGSYLLAHGLSIALVFAGYGATALYLRELVLSVLILVGLFWLGGLPRYPVRWVRPREWLAIARQSRGLYADGVLSSSFRRLVVLLAGLFAGDVGAGYFFQALRLAGVPHQVLDPVVGRLSLNWFSREGDPRAQRRARNRMLLLAALPLGLAAAITLVFADVFVPWLFGEQWRPVVSVLIGLSGYLVLASLLETLKMYCMATHRMRILLIGRVAQYAGLLAPLCIGAALGSPDAARVGLAVSIGYAAAFATTAGGLWLVGSGRKAAG